MFGTKYYVAPEILTEEEYDSKIDVWSLGISFYVLYFGRFPVQ